MKLDFSLLISIAEDAIHNKVEHLVISKYSVYDDTFGNRRLQGSRSIEFVSTAELARMLNELEMKNVIYTHETMEHIMKEVYSKIKDCTGILLQIDAIQLSFKGKVNTIDILAIKGDIVEFIRKVEFVGSYISPSAIYNFESGNYGISYGSVGLVSHKDGYRIIESKLFKNSRKYYYGEYNNINKAKNEVEVLSGYGSEVRSSGESGLISLAYFTCGIDINNVIKGV